MAFKNKTELNNIFHHFCIKRNIITKGTVWKLWKGMNPIILLFIKSLLPQEQKADSPPPPWCQPGKMAESPIPWTTFCGLMKQKRRLCFPGKCVTGQLFLKWMILTAAQGKEEKVDFNAVENYGLKKCSGWLKVLYSKKKSLRSSWQDVKTCI